MAEIVQFHLEESFAEFKQMTRFKLFSKKEVKQIIRKIKIFEYRLQRRTKNKKDYLAFINHENKLLQLVKLRKERLGVSSKRIPVEISVAKRIKRLYVEAVSKFKSDVYLWLSFIEFLQEMKFKQDIGRQYSLLLKLHCNKPELWAEAAKWEYKEFGNPQVARKTLLKGLRFNKDSKLLYQQLFELELISEKPKDKTAEEEDDEDAMRDGMPEEAINSAADTGLAEIVYRNAISEIKDAEFAISLLKICDEHAYASSLSEFICTDLQQQFNSDEVWRKAWAIRPLKNETEESFPQTDAEKECIIRFEDAVTSVPTEKMWKIYIKFCLRRLKMSRSLESVKEQYDNTMNVFARAAQDHKLSPKQIQKWANLALEQDKQLCGKILHYAVKRYPKMAIFWEERFRYALRNQFSDEKIHKLLAKGLKSISSSEIFNFWKMALQWYIIQDVNKVDSHFESGLQTHLSIAITIKSLYMDWLYSEHGYEATWKLYKRIWNTPPISLDVFNKMYQIIQTTQQPSIKRLRKVMHAAQSNFGQTDIEIWIQSMNIEKYASIEENRSAAVYQRAIKTLTPELVDQFIAYHTLNSTVV